MSLPKTDSAAIRAIIRALKAHGWELKNVYDGEEYIQINTEAEALDAILSVDIAHLYVTDGRKGFGVMFVMGNEPEEVVADYGVSLSEAIESVTDKWI